MSEEEKEAIEEFKKHIEYCKEFPTSCYDKEIEIVLNYIEKLQNENSSLKKEIKLMKSVNINENFISKDKIRNKLKEIEEEIRIIDEKENGGTHYIQVNVLIDFLKELLGDDK